MMLLQIAKPKTVRLFLLVVFCIFFVAGSVMLGVGIYRNVNRVQNVDDDVEEVSDSDTVIVAGCMDMAIGVFGVIGVVLKNRILLMVNAGLLASAILGNITLVIVHVTAYKIQSAAAQQTVYNMITVAYGNNSETYGLRTTNDIDTHQELDVCCGWAGNVNGENLFLKSPWYRENNMGKAENDKNIRTLPDSCCIKHDPKCFSAKNVAEARNAGFVKKDDCYEKIDRRAYIIMWLMVVQFMFTTVMQMLCTGIIVISLLQPQDDS